MEYVLERLKIEQIVVTEQYARDTLQWEKLRSFWHPDPHVCRTSLKYSWFNGTIDKYITELRTTRGINPEMKKDKKSSNQHVMGLAQHAVNPVDATSTSHPLLPVVSHLLLV